MKLWLVSDLHMERRPDFSPPRPPDFDVLVCAGDVADDIGEALESVRGIAGDKLAIFVAGNHEFFGDITVAETIERAHHYANKYGVVFLENSMREIGGVRFAGATLWDLHTYQHRESVRYLRQSRADVVVTHFPPSRADVVSVGANLWIYGHHHGFYTHQLGNTRLVRNALGYPDPAEDPRPGQPDFVMEI